MNALPHEHSQLQLPGAAPATPPEGVQAWIEQAQHEFDLVRHGFRRDVERGALPEDVPPRGWVP